MYYLKRKKSLFVFSTELYLPLYSSCSFMVFCSGILSFPYFFKISFPYLCGIYFLTPISTRMYMDFMNRKKELENELFSTTHWISLNSSTDQYFDCLTPNKYHVDMVNHEFILLMVQFLLCSPTFWTNQW